MRKLIVFLLTISLLMTSFIQVFAMDANDKSLEKAITNVKSLIEIPKEFNEFEYYVNSEDGEKNWRLSWSLPKDNKTFGEITVRVNDDGFITSYEKYSPDEKYADNDKLPKYSRQYAEDVAKKFIYRLYPGISDKLEANNEDHTGYRSKYYDFNFHLKNDGIPYYDFHCWITVDGDTGEIRSYNANKIKNLSFPSREGIIDKQIIEKAIKDQIGLELRYLQNTDETNKSVYPAYVLTKNGSAQFDAITGKLLDNSIDINVNIHSSEGYMGSENFINNKTNNTNTDSAKLTTEEYDAVKEISNIISKEEAEKIARSIPELKLDNNYVTSYFYLNKSYKNKNQYNWYFDFRKDNEYDYERDFASVSINALTGKIESFDFPNSLNAKDKTKVQYIDAKSTAETLAKKLEPEKFKQVELYDEKNLIKSYSEVSTAVNYDDCTFTYRRLVNGIPCESDCIRIHVDPFTGEVNNYSIDWYDGEFPAIEKTISLEEAYNILFKEVGIELYYVNYKPEDYFRVKKENDIKNEIKLVYSINKSKHTNIDIKTGKLLDYNGKPYIERKTLQYSDISGHYAEQAIKILQEYGVGFNSERFLPEQYITQLEFLELIYKSKTHNYLQQIEKEKLQQYLYENLLKMNIINKDEEAPDSLVTREDAIKFIIRSMNYEKIAQMKDIFICDFNDKADISQNLVGYIAISKGLGLITGSNGQFLPKSQITRAEAATLIYNSIK